jgi:hypothetical protein
MLDVFQKLQFTVSPLRQHGSTEGLHDLLHCNGDACKLILCGTVDPMFSSTDMQTRKEGRTRRDRTPLGKARIRAKEKEAIISRTHSNRLEVNISSGHLKRWINENDLGDL